MYVINSIIDCTSCRPSNANQNAINKTYMCTFQCAQMN